MLPFHKQFLSESGIIAYDTDKGITGTSAVLLSIIVALWSILPQVIELPNYLQFLKCGLENVDWKNNYGNALLMLIIPSSASFIYQKAPKIIPNAKIRLLTNIATKIIPVIILTIFIWFILKMKAYFKARENEKSINIAKHAENKKLKIEKQKELIVQKQALKILREENKKYGKKTN
ncbi:hypothetical protein [Spiroplasma endosymbiont of Glossina fuscipes fuscipes]|uniref:hypothetical protein n=1 Tax=Spiroplasma endosymbiont of Glossina fuscipes fuscipes TaxID=2004463 RepID=UPI003C74C8D9